MTANLRATLILASALLSSSVVAEPPAESAAAIAAKAAVEKMNSKLQNFMKDVQHSGCSDFYADDAYILPPGRPALHGRAQFDIPTCGGGGEVYGSEIMTASDDGTLVVDLGWLKTGVNSGKLKVGKYMAIWGKQPDGSWKIEREIAAMEK